MLNIGTDTLITRFIVAADKQHDLIVETARLAILHAMDLDNMGFRVNIIELIGTARDVCEADQMFADADSVMTRSLHMRARNEFHVSTSFHSIKSLTVMHLKAGA